MRYLIFKLLYVLFCLATAMIGYQKHGSVFWSIVNFCFAPLSWIKWLIYHEINLTIIKETFAFFLK